MTLLNEKERDLFSAFYYIHGVACDVFVDPFKVPTFVV